MIPPSAGTINKRHFSFCHSIHPCGHDKQEFCFTFQNDDIGQIHLLAFEQIKEWRQDKSLEQKSPNVAKALQ